MKRNIEESKKEITDVRELAIYKVCEIYPGFSWGDVLDIALRMLNAWGFGNLIPSKVDRENLRKTLEKMVENGIIIKTLTKPPLYYVNKNVELKIPEPLKIWDNRFQTYLISKQIGGEELIRILREHTERIKERIIRPWINVLSEEINTVEESGKFKEIEEDIYYKDLDTHIPLGLENPKEVKKIIDNKRKEFHKLKDSILYIEFRISLEKDYSENDFNKIKKQIENLLPKNIPNEIKEIILNKDINLALNKKQELEEKLELLKREILSLKRKLLNILKELEGYEVFPGVCRYLTGGD